MTHGVIIERGTEYLTRDRTDELKIWMDGVALISNRWLEKNGCWSDPMTLELELRVKRAVILFPTQPR